MRTFRRKSRRNEGISLRFRMNAWRELVMNLKATHLVAVQFGIFIGMVTCLVLFRFEFARPRVAAERQEPGTERAAAVEQKSEPEEEFADLADDGGELESSEALTAQADSALPNEYSPEAVQRSMAILTKLYYEQISPRRNLSASAANTAVAPSSTEVAEEPAVEQIEEPPPQPVAYVPPTQVIVYPQPIQFISFSHPRRFDHRRRPARNPTDLASNSRRGRDSGTTRLNGMPQFRPPRSVGSGQRWTTSVPTCPSTPGSTA